MITVMMMMKRMHSVGKQEWLWRCHLILISYAVCTQSCLEDVLQNDAVNLSVPFKATSTEQKLIETLKLVEICTIACVTFTAILDGKR